MFTQSRQVLIVDDNPDDAFLLKQSLSATGLNLQVTEIQKGGEAVTYLRRLPTEQGTTRPELIVLDLNLPELNGLELIQMIRTNPTLKTIPIIVMTGSDDPKKIGDSYAAGANCCIKKPSTNEEFTKVAQAIHEFWFSVLRLPPMN